MAEPCIIKDGTGVYVCDGPLGEPLARFYGKRDAAVTRAVLQLHAPEAVELLEHFVALVAPGAASSELGIREGSIEAAILLKNPRAARVYREAATLLRSIRESLPKEKPCATPSSV